VFANTVTDSPDDCCAFASDIQDGDTCCDYRGTDTPGDTFGDLRSILEVLCPIARGEYNVACDGEKVSTPLGLECSDDPPRSARATERLGVDPDQSFFHIDGPTLGNATISLDGLASFSSSEPAFVALYAESGAKTPTSLATISNLQVFGFDEIPVQLSGSTYQSSGEPTGLLLQLEIDGATFGFTPGGNFGTFSGVMDPNNGLWSTTYSGTTDAGDSLTVHLAGAATGL
jgi:hypothetical protein